MVGYGAFSVDMVDSLFWNGFTFVTYLMIENCFSCSVAIFVVLSVPILHYCLEYLLYCTVVIN